ncbi:N-acetylmuramoyl-L-alanine amidase [uncultured Clostridium sp.]|uniref:Ig-like domain-containing protein n=1 Tax=uncultured Clostridium sp. TaxID=59620 RepID=UPI00345336BD
MYKQKKIVTWLLILAFTISFLPSITVKATDNMKIISTTNITVAEAKAWAKERGATNTFISLADLYWKYAASRGNVNPAVAYVQAAKETGYGKFGGVINESYHNPCGLKTTQGGSDTDPNAHMKFNSWDEGVQAHLDHLALYAGASGYPRSDTYDPRHFSSIKGKATTVVSLGGNWAPSSTYGSDILFMYRQMEFAERNKKMYGNIDEPVANSTVYSTTINVRGWALNPSGISKVNVYIDDVLKGNATIGQSREDVANTYLGYAGASTSGFSMKVDISGLSVGTKTLKVEQIGKDGTKNVITTKFNVAKLSSIQNIDTPSNGSTVTSNLLTVSGWSLSRDTIKNINFYIDGKLKDSTTTGISRKDVANVYPQYPNASTSGFSKTLNLSDVSNGSRVLKVEQVTSNGEKYSTELKINVQKLNPITVIDEPVNGSNITKSSLNIKGWALNGSGVKSINIYVDSNLVKTISTGIERADVKSVYPQYNDGKSGYNTTIDLSSLPNGTKTIKVEQVGKDGSTNSITKTINLKLPKLDSIGNIDAPVNNSDITSDKVTVSGWAISDSGVKEVKVYIDGKEKGSTTVNGSRPDVGKVYPQYKNSSKSGFSLDVDISDIASGTKTIEVKGISNDGSIHSIYSKINIVRLSSIQNIDTPINNASITGSTLEVSGWSLSGNDIKSINLYIDGILMGSTIPNISRKDVAKVYPQYPNASTSGFKKTLDISQLSSGTKTLKVEQVTSSGAKYSSEVKINIRSLNPITVIDVPSNDSTITKTSLEISGWALNGKGVKTINIYIDSALVKTTTTGISRIDVNNVYPQYNDSKSGYKETIDLTGVGNGKRTIKVEQVGTDGSKATAVTTINLNVSKLAPISNIDTPVANSNINSTKVNVSGWAISDSGVKEVKVYVEGIEKGSTAVGLSRTDVAKVYPQYKNSDKSGFSVDIDINNIPPGSKTFEIRQLSNDGTISTTSIKANIVKKSPITVIDTPTDYYLEKGDTINVVGWALNASGISNINVYVDGNKKASVKPTISRQDVINVYPGYQTNNVCGYTTSVSLAGLVAGSHKILVEAVGVDGTINTVSKNIYYKENPSKLIVLDPGHNHGGDDGAYSTHNGVRYSERDINMDIAMKTKAALEAKGYRVVLTRTPFDIEYLSVNDSLTKRVELANSLNADLFISIHQNSFDKESANGTEVYYTTKSNDSGFPASPNKAYKLSTSKTLANNIVNNISSIGFTNRGAKDGNLFVVRNTIMPAVLVECGFISNLKDVTNLTNSNIQEKIATAIANGVYGNF